MIYAGEVVEHGSVHDIFHRPSHPYTRRLLTCDPARVAADWSGDLPTIPGDVPDLIDARARLRVRAALSASAIDRCRMEAPPAVPIAGGHMARCHLRGSRVNDLLTVDALRVRFRRMARLAAMARRAGRPLHRRGRGRIPPACRRAGTFGLVGESGSGKSTLGRAVVRSGSRGGGDASASTAPS